MLPVLLPFLALIWGVHTWSVQHETEARRERDKRAALYGNPFLLACDELQSRLYNLLSDEMTFEILRSHYPEGEYAEETLYLIFQYFGWERHVFRYSPYSLDPDVIRLTARVRDTFASSQEFPMGPFCFFRTEQRALGDSVIEQTSTEAGMTEETMPFFKFVGELKKAPLCEVRSVQEALEAIKTAPCGPEIVGGDRLAQVQKYLVELVNYLESNLGVHLRNFSREAMPPIGTIEATDNDAIVPVHDEATTDLVTTDTAKG